MHPGVLAILSLQIVWTLWSNAVIKFNARANSDSDTAFNQTAILKLTLTRPKMIFQFKFNKIVLHLLRRSTIFRLEYGSQSQTHPKYVYLVVG